MKLEEQPILHVIHVIVLRIITKGVHCASRKVSGIGAGDRLFNTSVSDSPFGMVYRTNLICMPSVYIRIITVIVQTV